jgi:hypothetical protein
LENSVVDPDLHHVRKLEPDPHQSVKLDPDRHQSEKQDLICIKVKRQKATLPWRLILELLKAVMGPWRLTLET